AGNQAEIDGVADLAAVERLQEMAGRGVHEVGQQHGHDQHDVETADHAKDQQEGLVPTTSARAGNLLPLGDTGAHCFFVSFQPKPYALNRSCESLERMAAISRLASCLLGEALPTAIGWMAVAQGMPSMLYASTSSPAPAALLM